MNEILLAVAAFLLLNIAAGLVRVMLGPRLADRMLAVQLFGTTGVAITLILAEVHTLPALINVALVFALLAAVTVSAFVRVLPNQERAGDGQ